MDLQTEDEGDTTMEVSKALDPLTTMANDILPRVEDATATTTPILDRAPDARPQCQIATSLVTWP